MSLNKSQLINNLTALFKAEQSEELDANASVERLANGMADAFELFVKSGTVEGICPQNGGQLINGKVI